MDIDFSIYDGWESFTVLQAAMAWAGVKVYDGTTRPMVNGLVKEIIQASFQRDGSEQQLKAPMVGWAVVRAKNDLQEQVRLPDGRFRRVREDDYYFSEEVLREPIERAALVDWFNRRGQQPKFLFPEARQSDKPADTREVANLRRAVLALVELVGEDTGRPGLKHQTNVVDAIKRILESNGLPTNGQSTSTLSRWLKAARND